MVECRFHRFKPRSGGLTARKRPRGHIRGGGIMRPRGHTAFLDLGRGRTLIDGGCHTRRRASCLSTPTVHACQAGEPVPAEISPPVYTLPHGDGNTQSWRRGGLARRSTPGGPHREGRAPARPGHTRRLAAATLPAHSPLPVRMPRIIPHHNLTTVSLSRSSAATTSAGR